MRPSKAPRRSKTSAAGLPLAVAVVVVLAGCAGKISVETPNAGDPSEVPTIELGSAVWVSPPEHRMGEFFAAAAPGRPDHIFVNAVDLDNPNTNCLQLASTDGGRTWTQSNPIPVLHDKGWTSFDPWISVGPDGRVHATCILYDGSLAAGAGIAAVRPRSNSLVYASSADAGTTWTPAKRLVPWHPDQGVDKGTIFAAADGNIHACMFQSGAGQQPEAPTGLVLFRSDDGGSRWTRPDRPANFSVAYGRQPTSCNGFTEGPTGEIYVAWSGSLIPDAPSNQGVAASRDGGLTWEPPTIVLANWTSMSAGANLVEQNVIGRTRPLANTLISIDASPTSGALAATAMTYNRSSDRGEVFVWKSNDHGQSFQPIQLPPIPSNICQAQCHSTHPMVVFDSAGRLALQLMVSEPRLGGAREVWFLVTPDEGASWLAPAIIASIEALPTPVDVRNFIPRDPAAAAVDQAIHALEDPVTAADRLSWYPAPYARLDHPTWGGDYWAIRWTSSGFLAMWEQPDETGTNAIMARPLWLQSSAK
jgi:hypothetical protein